MSCMPYIYIGYTCLILSLPASCIRHLNYCRRRHFFYSYFCSKSSNVLRTTRLLLRMLSTSETHDQKWNSHHQSWQNRHSLDPHLFLVSLVFLLFLIFLVTSLLFLVATLLFPLSQATRVLSKLSRCRILFHIRLILVVMLILVVSVKES